MTGAAMGTPDHRREQKHWVLRKATFKKTLPKAVMPRMQKTSFPSLPYLQTGEVVGIRR